MTLCRASITEPSEDLSWYQLTWRIACTPTTRRNISQLMDLRFMVDLSSRPMLTKDMLLMP